MPHFDPHPDRRPAVVTGASSGIGAATAEALAALGHPVVLGARRLDRLEAIAERIRSAGGEATAITLDLVDAASVATFAAEASEAFGPVDVVVSNAGDVVPTTTLDMDPDTFASSVELNLLGAQRLLGALGPGMVERGHGDVVFVTSDVTVRPRTHMGAYVASKWGLEGMARAMQMELEGTGVRVGIVRPGPSLTEQGSTWSQEDLDRVLPAFTAWGHMRHAGILDAANVADAIVAMVSVPKGTHLTLIEVEPEAPVTDDRSTS